MSGDIDITVCLYIIQIIALKSVLARQGHPFSIRTIWSRYSAQRKRDGKGCKKRYL